MKSTEHFKNTVKAYLDKRADEDELFAATYARTGKNMDDCTVYILNTVRQSGCNGFTDDEIYSMALHYWDEENIETGNPVDCQVVVNHTVELTAGEREEARREAMKKAQDEAYSRLKRPQRKAKQTVVSNQLSLF